MLVCVLPQTAPAALVCVINTAANICWCIVHTQGASAIPNPPRQLPSQPYQQISAAAAAARESEQVRQQLQPAQLSELGALHQPFG
jgi:hypothetical protein